MPITSAEIVTGYLGSGKTSVLGHLVAHPTTPPSTTTPVRTVAIVNELGAINPDAQTLHDAGIPTVDLSGGPIETDLRDRFASVLRRLHRDPAPVRVLIEASGVATPGELTWTIGDAVGTDTPTALITVVDASTFLDDRLSGAPTTSNAQGVTSGPTVGLPTLLTAQIEAADVVVVNKTDLAPATDTRETEAIIRRSNPQATVVRAVRGGFDTNLIRHTTPPATMTAGATCGVETLVFSARRPLHPGRTHALLAGGSIAATRSKGLCWLATRDTAAMWWNQSGADSCLTEGPAWWAATEPSRWPCDEQTWARIYATWAAPFGDRRQELVLSGVGLDAEYHRLLLQSCLLTNEEMAGAVALADPFEAGTTIHASAA